MKAVLLLSYFTLLFFSISKAQGNYHRDSIKNEVLPKNGLYILDSIQKYRSIKEFQMDEDDCYLQIMDAYAVISYRTRGKNYFISGNIHNSAINQVEVDSIITFTIVSDNKFPGSLAGKRIFVGIHNDSLNNNCVIYTLNNRKQIEYIFKSHIATTSEKIKLEKRSMDQIQN